MIQTKRATNALNNTQNIVQLEYGIGHTPRSHSQTSPAVASEVIFKKSGSIESNFETQYFNEWLGCWIINLYQAKNWETVTYRKPRQLLVARFSCLLGLNPNCLQLVMFTCLTINFQLKC